jgi:FkbM family methyltransferase
MLNRAKSKIRQIFRVSGCASSWVDRLHVIFWSIWLAVRHRIGLALSGASKLKFRYEGVDFGFYANYSTDIAMLDEIFIDKVYEFDYGGMDPKVIFDVGSNTGVSIKFLRLKFPKSEIYAFEPDPAVFKSLELNARDAGKVHSFNIAVASENGPIKFYVHPKSPIVSSLSPRFKEQEEILVEGKNLSAILDELRITEIDLLKFDVEGAERGIFESFDTRRINALVGEFHSDLANMTLDEFKAIFPHHDFEFRQVSPIRYMVFAKRKYIKANDNSCK